MNYDKAFLPEVNNNDIDNNENIEVVEVTGNYLCPCCGYITIPNNGDALAYICPVCMWEIDLFIKDDNESSDLNNGLSLKQARYNYKKYGAVLQKLKQYCREPKEYELW